MKKIQSKIRKTKKEDLLDSKKLHRLIVDIGFSDRRLDQQPKHLHKYAKELAPWQTPRQLTKLILFLADYKIKSYLEIGAYRCGTFLVLTEIFNKLNGLDYALAIDPNKNKYQEELSELSKDINRELKNMKSADSSLIKELGDRRFDLILVDGDHCRGAVVRDFELYRKKGDILLFHDISSVCKDSWKDIKGLAKNDFDIYEIVDQYKTVKKNWFGFGILVKKGENER